MYSKRQIIDIIEDVATRPGNQLPYALLVADTHEQVPMLRDRVFEAVAETEVECSITKESWMAFYIHVQKEQKVVAVHS